MPNTQNISQLTMRNPLSPCSNRSTVLPSGLLSALCSVDSRFRGYEQQDSHELFQALLDAAGSEALKKRRVGEGQKEAKRTFLGGSEPEPFPCSVFAGRTVSVVTCGKCGEMSNVTGTCTTVNWQSYLGALLSELDFLAFASSLQRGLWTCRSRSPPCT